MAETILSYLLAELESSNPQRISKKMGGLGSGEDGISPYNPVDRGWRMGRPETIPIVFVGVESSKSAKDFEKNGRSGIRRRRHLSL